MNMLFQQWILPVTVFTSTIVVVIGIYFIIRMSIEIAKVKSAGIQTEKIIGQLKLNTDALSNYVNNMERIDADDTNHLMKLLKDIEKVRQETNYLVSKLKNNTDVLTSSDDDSNVRLATAFSDNKVSREALDKTINSLSETLRQIQNIKEKAHS